MFWASTQSQALLKKITDPPGITDLDSELSIFKEALNLTEDLEGKLALYTNYATFLIQQGRYNQAIEITSEAHNSGFREFPIYQALSSAHFHLGNYRAAETAMKDAIETDQKNSQAHFALSVILQAQGNHEEALVSIDSAIANSNSKLQDVFLQRSVILRDLGKIDDARVMCEMLIIMGGKSFDTYIQMASISQDLGDYSAAKENFQSALKAAKSTEQIAQANSALNDLAALKLQDSTHTSEPNS